jgi:hypothetical protein
MILPVPFLAFKEIKVGDGMLKSYSLPLSNP